MSQRVDILDMNDKVSAFNLVSGNKVADYQSLIPSYHKFTEEEFEELVTAIDNKDDVEVVDAVCDLVYTGFYLSKLKTRETIIQRGYSSYNKMLVDTGILLDVHRMPFREVVSALSDFLVVSNYKAVHVCIIRLVFLLEKQGVDMQGAFNEVTSSNMSKFVDTTGTSPTQNFEMISKEITKLEDAGRYGNISYNITFHNSKGYVSFRAGSDITNNRTFDAPKIVKPSTFFEPKLEKFLPAEGLSFE